MQDRIASPAGVDFRAEIAAELQDNLLPYWRYRVGDSGPLGFVAEKTCDGRVNPNAELGLILASRLLWTYSAVYRRFEDRKDLELAGKAYDLLEDVFRDDAHGGFFWKVSPDGSPFETDKKIYGQAFAVYALSELFLATGRSKVLGRAVEVFDLVEEHGHDDDFGGYLEARARDWSESPSLQLSKRDIVAPKSMNTQLHMLEALTSLYRAWPAPRVETRLRELITLFEHTIWETKAGHCFGHLHSFFDVDWGVLADSYTFGHDIEATWLLCEAAEALGDEQLIQTAKVRAVVVARVTVEQAVGDDGGLAYEGRAGQVVDDNRDWWCQAEAVVGFWNAYQIAGTGAFSDAARRVWSFINNHHVDHEGGDWFWRVRRDGTVETSRPKISAWKGPYHNVRMCLEILGRTGGTAS